MRTELLATQRRAKTLLLVVMGSLVLVSGGLLLAAMAYLRQDTLQSTARFTSTISQLIATQVAGTLQIVDEGLHVTAVLLDASAPLNVQQTAVVITTQLKVLPFLSGLWLLDGQGRVLSGSSLPFFDVNGTYYLDYFNVHRDYSFLVAVPIRDKNGTWQIPIARPIRKVNGDARQVLITLLPANYFENIWLGPDIGPEGSISLMGRDGTMFSRSPFVDKAMSQSYKNRPVFQTMLPASELGYYRDTSSVDSVERWFAYQVVPGHADLVVIAGQSLSYGLRRWTQWAKLLSLTWLGGSMIVLVLGFLSLRGLRKRHAAEISTANSNMRYQVLFEDAIDGILLASPDGRVQSANRAACDMLGHTQESIRALGRGGLLDPADPRIARSIVTRIATGKFRGELTFVRKDGSKFEGDVSSVIHYEDNGDAQSTVIFRDVTERNRVQEQLAAHGAKMQELSRRAIRAQEDERSHIARELHDALGQSLTAIKINLQSGANFKGQDPQELQLENIRIVDDVLQQVRQIAASLRPSVLDNLGLVPALAWLGKQSSMRSDLVFRIEATPLEKRLDPDLETTCFRIAQEAITNTVRHAKAKNLSIQLALKDNQLLMQIEDDGVGMDWEFVRSRPFPGRDLGTTGMAERANLVGGHLQIRSAPRAGCTVIFRCSLEDRQDTSIEASI